MMIFVVMVVVGVGVIGCMYIQILVDVFEVYLVVFVDLVFGGLVLVQLLGVFCLLDVGVLIDVGLVQVVIVVILNEMYFLVVQVLLWVGLLVLLEKFVVESFDVVLWLIVVVDDIGVLLLIGYYCRYNFIICIVYDQICNGVFGDFVMVLVMVFLVKLLDYFQVDWWCSVGLGGLLLINFVYEIDLL